MGRSHIAILKSDYLEMILAGVKRLECRLARTRRVPYGQVGPGEMVLLKESGGPIRGRAEVEKVLFFEDLDAGGIERLKRDYNGEIMGEDKFWRGRQDCRYGSLIWLRKVQKVKPYRIAKKGMQAWVVEDRGSPVVER